MAKNKIKSGVVMARLLCTGVILFSFTCGACGPSPYAGPTNENENTNTNDGPTCEDADGDGISDQHEGRDQEIDTNGDGVPDYLDLDSDGDGIPDSIEAGTVCGASPVDSDGDGVPDFRDLDSDGNGIPDSMEGLEDQDGNGTLDFADQDDDGDGIPDTVEIGHDPMNPIDTDGDGVPDYKDIDSDGDTILDIHEGMVDNDGDGVPNYRDLDSDGDGIPDAIEAGDADPMTPPVDSDGDGIPDFLDLDSDNDGLPDSSEYTGPDGIPGTGDETDPTNPDSDGDGISDLVEIVAGTDPNDPTDNPRENGDFVFLVPYEEPPEPEEDRLAFSTTFKELDIYILIDRSGSMQDEMDSIRGNLVSMIDEVTCGPNQDPITDFCIPDVESGCGRFGVSGEVWSHLKDIDPNHSGTQSALPTNASGGSERHIQAMSGAINGTCASDAARKGTACFRNDSLGLIMMVTDEDFREDSWYNGQNMYDTYDTMAALGIRVVGVTGNHSEVGNLRSDLMAMSGGNPPIQLVPSILSIPPTPQCANLGSNPFFSDRAIVDGPDQQAGDAMTCAIQAITAYLPQDVYTIIENDPSNVDMEGNPIDAVDSFVDRIEVFQDGSAECSDGNTVQDSTGDGFSDMFQAILPGTPVCWKLYVKQNNTVEPDGEQPQMFTATVEVHGEGNALLDEREVYFLVPPVIEGPILN